MMLAMIYNVVRMLYVYVIPCNHGHRRGHHSRTYSRAHESNAPCDDNHDRDDKGRDDGHGIHDHSCRVQQLSKQEQAQRLPSSWSLHK